MQSAPGNHPSWHRQMEPHSLVTPHKRTLHRVATWTVESKDGDFNVRHTRQLTLKCVDWYQHHVSVPWQFCQLWHNVESPWEIASIRRLSRSHLQWVVLTMLANGIPSPLGMVQSPWLGLLTVNTWRRQDETHTCMRFILSCFWLWIWVAVRGFYIDCPKMRVYNLEILAI